MGLDKAIEILEEHIAGRRLMEEMTENTHFKIESGLRDLNIAIETVLKAYKNLYNAVDKMFYDAGNQWEKGADIEDFIGDLRELMYVNKDME